MSDTSRTDAIQQRNPSILQECVRYRELARQLERELAAERDLRYRWKRTWESELQQERAARERAEKRIAAALEELDGYEDVEDRPNGEGVRPNLAMRVGMILRGEDRP